LALLKIFIVQLCGVLSLLPVYSQSKDSIPAPSQGFPVKSYIIPALAIGYGVISLNNAGLIDINKQVKEEIWTESPHPRKRIDDFLPMTPAVIVYGLNAAGLHGRNNFRDRSMIYLLSNVIMNGTIFPLKHLTQQQRPDSSDYYSFPSGHTAEAFLSAEFMWQEYKDVSPWIGASGYLLAATTGYLRLYNNKHWLGDVVAGAGVGIASTKLAYWLYPKFKDKIFKNKLKNTAVLPFYRNGCVGLGLVHVM
jgi:hypothetical protein